MSHQKREIICPFKQRVAIICQLQNKVVICSTLYLLHHRETDDPIIVVNFFYCDQIISGLLHQCLKGSLLKLPYNTPQKYFNATNVKEDNYCIIRLKKAISITRLEQKRFSQNFAILDSCNEIKTSFPSFSKKWKKVFTQKVCYITWFF